MISRYVNFVASTKANASQSVSPSSLGHSPKEFFFYNERQTKLFCPTCTSFLEAINWEEIDATILDTVARGAKEETGLEISAVLCKFEGFEDTTKRGPASRLNFLVEVRPAATSGYNMGEVMPIWNPTEHQAYIWARAGDSLEKLPMSDDIRIVVKNAFKAIDE